MSDVTNPPERQFRFEHAGIIGVGNTGDTAPSELTLNDDPARPESSARWPFSTQSCSPLAWWRRLPPQECGNSECLHLVTTLRGITVLHGADDIAAALDGDASAAINIAVVLMPIEKVTLQVDITMAALMRVALNGSAAAALVMAQVIGLTDVGHEFANELATFWLDHGERHSKDPERYREARTVLLTAFEHG
jgi:hypothetical protein